MPDPADDWDEFATWRKAVPPMPEQPTTANHAVLAVAGCPMALPFVCVTTEGDYRHHYRVRVVSNGWAGKHTQTIDLSADELRLVARAILDTLSDPEK